MILQENLQQKRNRLHKRTRYLWNIIFKIEYALRKLYAYTFLFQLTARITSLRNLSWTSKICKWYWSTFLKVRTLVIKDLIQSKWYKDSFRFWMSIRNCIQENHEHELSIFPVYSRHINKFNISVKPNLLSYNLVLFSGKIKKINHQSYRSSNKVKIIDANEKKLKSINYLFAAVGLNISARISKCHRNITFIKGQKCS